MKCHVQLDITRYIYTFQCEIMAMFVIRQLLQKFPAATTRDNTPRLRLQPIIVCLDMLFEISVCERWGSLLGYL